MLKAILLTPFIKTLALTAVFCILFGSAYTQIAKFNSFSAASATVYLDFDGHVVKGTSWNWDSTIHAKAAGLPSAVVTEIFNRVAEDFRIFNLNITTDPDVYSNAPPAKRMRIIITPSYEWYGEAAGISFINSFTWGDETPAWVFTVLLENNPKFIAEVASHEIGHTLGLQHQSKYSRDCNLISEYSEGNGNGETGWAPIMGVGYYKNLTVWTFGQSIEDCSILQNDISIISNGISKIGMRTDDHGNNMQTASSPLVSGIHFQSSGIINNATDRDYFKITLPRRQHLNAQIIPNNVGPQNEGANVDLLITLIKNNGDTIGKYNPKTLLDASLDTILPAGIYYIEVDGTGNENVSDYGSAGHYSLTGTVVNAKSNAPMIIKGNRLNNLNLINWNASYDGSGIYLEYSFDGIHFRTLTDVAPIITQYSHTPPGNGQLFYRLRKVQADETVEYSNTITLTNPASDNVLLSGNIIRNSIVVKTNGNYLYQITDESGRLIQKGRLMNGTNTVQINYSNRGIIFMKVITRDEEMHFKLIKQ